MQQHSISEIGDKSKSHHAKSIRLSAFDATLAKEFKALDVNNDGFIDFQEIEKAVVLLLQQKKRNTQLIYLICFLLLLLTAVMGSTFGVMYIVVDMKKVSNIPISISTTEASNVLCWYRIL
jgi:hypothetical protein